MKLGHAVLRSEVPGLLARADVLVNNMRAGATDKVVYEACASCTPAIASNPAFDSLLPDELRFGREDPRSLADSLLALGARPAEERAGLGRTLRDRVAAEHSVERGRTRSWRRRRGRGNMTAMDGTRVLHLQKVAGISGSEAHLLSLLPRLRERGWDIRMLMLHEDEPGAWDFARALEATGVPLDTMRLRADVDPLAFFELGGYLARHRPEILHTHLVHADAYGQMAGLLARVPVRFSTKHGFNEFREGRAFALGDRTVASLAHVHIAISRGLARYLANTEGFAEDSFEIVHYGIGIFYSVFSGVLARTLTPIVVAYDA